MIGPSSVAAVPPAGPHTSTVGALARGPPMRLTQFRRSWLLEAHVLVRRGEVEQRVQADPGLLDPWSYPVQRGRLEDRQVHDALVHEPLDLMQQRLTPAAVALLGLLGEQVVDVGGSAAGIRRAADNERLDA